MLHSDWTDLATTWPNPYQSSASIVMDIKWCKSCQINELNQNFTIWTSGNKMIDDFIQEIRLNVNGINDIIVEWIPYNQWERIAYKKVTLKYLYNSRNNISKFLNGVERVPLHPEVKLYSTNKSDKSNIKIYGMSQDPDTKDYILILQDSYCEKCGKMYANMKDVSYKWCKPCQINDFKQNFANWTIEWIPYNKFIDFKEIGKGGFATVNLAMWIDGPLKYGKKKMGWERMPNKKVALKSLHNTQNITSEFLNEVKAYSYSYSNPIDNIPQNDDGILKIYGITQNPSTKDYVIILQYAGEGNLYNYKDISKNWYWAERLYILRIIIKGLEKIHKTQMVHRDFHIGNILMLSEYALTTLHSVNKVCISDMGLCGEIGNMDETKIYGVMPYMAPEVLRGNPYIQAADIYSFGMIMYFIATGRQPFDDRAHDEILALNICNGTRPEIDDQGVPEFYIDVMKKCWDSNPENRPTASEIEKSINVYNPESGKEIMKQNNKADEYRKANLLSIRNATHPQAYYTSRLLNPFTKDLPKYDTECLECAIDD
ncbi:hypothetical protein RclHR1_08500003 [Rhizophagus clarus]|uniref:Protein kinase domain-containing protein n=1 Tax=Rhizophagus clarus TaxID=94130 RepID=A0A2Z6S0Q4_9GLOM|nr:hypothetical protein RclHR1_08500003 [Rhizophagus clarus]